MILGSVQPSYLAWIPFFDRMKMSDVFVYLDDVEYSRNSFHNRNRIKTKEGTLILTVPVLYSGHSKEHLNKIQIDYSKSWPKKHWRSIELAYARAPYFQEIAPSVREHLFYRWDSLADLNIALIEFFRTYLGISTPTHRSSKIPIEGVANVKLVNICKKLRADSFLVKPNTEHYHPREAFAVHGISLSYLHMSSQLYPQLHGEFVPHVSILDYAMNCGPNSFT